MTVGTASRRSVRALAGILLLTLTPLGSGCASAGGAASGAAGTAAGPRGDSLTVYAASSLKGTFTELGSRFEAAHPGTTVAFDFAGSSELATQIEAGAPADVFASADPRSMTQLGADHLVAQKPVSFASNRLEIAVPPGNPGRVTSLADLTRSDVAVVLCAPQVPCGSAARAVQSVAKIRIRPVSEESAVVDVLNKVEAGEADAGLVYVTDVRSAGSKVIGIGFPESTQVVNTYPIAALAGSRQAGLAHAFVDLVTSAEGRQVFAGAGFGRP